MIQASITTLSPTASAFWAEGAFEEEVVVPIDVVESRLIATPESFVLGAFNESGHLVGVAGFLREKSSKYRHKRILWGMFVAPEVRGHGIGKQLLDEIVERAKHLEGLEQIILDVITVNTAARNLYLRAGFQPNGVEKRAMKQGTEYFDTEHMVLYLS